MANRCLKFLYGNVQARRAEAENTADHFQHREVRPEYIRKLKHLVAAKGKAYASVEELVRDTGR